MAKCLNLEHKVLRTLPRPRTPERWLLALSGGVDSMVLADVLYRWRRYLKIEIAIAHVFHGVSGDSVQNEYRQSALRFVRDYALNHQIPFLTNPSPSAQLNSEAELRRWRRHWLSKWRVNGAFDRVVLAHHADDLLETRLLRLLRGTGAQGLKSMAVCRARAVRPLLHVSRAEIRDYARIRQLAFVEDPSNQRADISLRNWLRREFLPRLENRSPGASQALSRSLAQLAAGSFVETMGPFVGLRREALRSLSVERQEAVVARYLRSLGMKDYSRRHVQELLKRLGTRRKPVAFAMLGHSFECTPDFLWAAPQGRVEFE